MQLTWRVDLSQPVLNFIDDNLQDWTNPTGTLARRVKSLLASRLRFVNFRGGRNRDPSSQTVLYLRASYQNFLLYLASFYVSLKQGSETAPLFLSCTVLTVFADSHNLDLCSVKGWNFFNLSREEEEQSN